MDNLFDNILWDALLELRSIVASQQNPVVNFSILLKNGVYQILEGTEPGTVDRKSIVISRQSEIYELPNTTFFHIDERKKVFQIGNNFLDDLSTHLMIQYLPHCFNSEIAGRKKRTFSILHLAQSLDGRIATISGHSKWVSNQENLIHSHRMRALCDGVMIGANTLKADTPELTVRFVKGPNPCKIILANKPCNFDTLQKSKDKILLFTHNTNFEAIEGVEIILLPNGIDQLITEIILKELFNRNIFTLYIEGGAKTASLFISEKMADKLQLFISPQIFGSGINSFSLPVIEKVDDAVLFSSASFYPMGNGVLFEGELKTDDLKTEFLGMKDSTLL
jgi:diaminohydroxyphosphoribosylaminopyrimidine deaminase / 5-amino-6-(5-phosphoribosylamino)uracil reductase